MTDAEFLRAFEAATLPRPEWTHAAHLRMAYLTLRDGETWDSVLPHVRDRIVCYNLAHGNRTGYHETITVAFLRIVADRLTRTLVTTFEAFAQANDDLFSDGAGALRRHYSDEALHSPAARATFVPPDLQPLPE